MASWHARTAGEQPTWPNFLKSGNAFHCTYKLSINSVYSFFKISYFLVNCIQTTKSPPAAAGRSGRVLSVWAGSANALASGLG